MIGTLPRFLVRGASTRQSVSFSASSKEMVRRIARSFEGVVVPYDNAVRSRWHKQKNSARLRSAFIFASVRWNFEDSINTLQHGFLFPLREIRVREDVLGQRGSCVAWVESGYDQTFDLSRAPSGGNATGLGSS